MKSGVIALLLAVAAAVTGGALYLLKDRAPRPDEAPAGPAPVDETGGADGGPGLGGHAAAQGAPALRPYETIETLTEDLRDALAHGTPQLDREWLRVSAALAPHARRVLSREARSETNPRVRALLVLAAGVHHPDGPEMLSALKDRSEVVRRAAVLTCGYEAGGTERFALWPGLEIPLGRRPEPASLRILELAGQRLKADLGGELQAVRRAAGISRSR